MSSLRIEVLVAVLLLAVLSCTEANWRLRNHSTWVPIQARTTPNITDSDMRFLASLGVTRLFVDVWNDGTVYFKSPTMSALVPDGGAFGGDFLQSILALASPHGIEVVAWLEYGFMAAYSVPNNFSRAASSNGWMLGKTTNSFYYLDPSNDQVLQFVAGLMMDLLQGYDGIRGVQLDDHFDCPVIFPSCSVDTMNGAAKYMHKHVGAVAASRGKTVCIAPTTAAYARSSFSVDWPLWMREGWFDEIAVQLYNSNASAFEGILNVTLEELSSATRSGFSAGVRVSGDPVTPWQEVAQMLRIAAAQNVSVVVALRPQEIQITRI